MNLFLSALFIPSLNTAPPINSNLKDELITSMNGQTITEEMKEDSLWFKVAPFGDFEQTVTNSKTGQSMLAVQRIDKEAAQHMLIAFNSLFNTVKHLGKGIPFYVGHADAPNKAADPSNAPGAVARMKKMEIREDGLWGYGVFNAKGVPLISGQAPEYTATSPYFLCVNTGLEVDGKPIIQPRRIKSIALTNDPNLPDCYIGLNQNQGLNTAKDGLAGKIRKALEAKNKEAEPGERITVADLAKAGGIEESTMTSILAGEIKDPPTHRLTAWAKFLDLPANTFTATNQQSSITNQQPENSMSEEQVNQLREALGLPETATATEIITAVIASAGDAAKTKTAETELAAANSKLEKFEGEQIIVAINASINAGKITEAQRDTWTAVLNADFEKGKEALDGLNVVALNTQDHLKDKKGLKDKKDEGELDYAAVNQAAKAELGSEYTHEQWNNAYAKHLAEAKAKQA